MWGLCTRGLSEPWKHTKCLGAKMWRGQRGQTTNRSPTGHQGAEAVRLLSKYGNNDNRLFFFFFDEDIWLSVTMVTFLWCCHLLDHELFSPWTKSLPFCWRYFQLHFCARKSFVFNQCWLIVNWTCSNKLQSNLNKKAKLFIHENALDAVICEMVAILSRGRRVNGWWYIGL